MIDFYTADTPNGLRVELMLEELNVEYKKHQLSLSKGDNKTSSFLKLNSSGRIPVIVDHEVINSEPLVLTQSAAILLYLAEKRGDFLPLYKIDRAKAMEWLFFDATDIATTRFNAFYLSMRNQEESTQILKDRIMEYYQTYDQQLATTAYLAGDEYSLADIAAYPWAKTMEHEGMKGLSHLQRWMKEIGNRAAIKRTFLET